MDSEHQDSIRWAIEKGAVFHESVEVAFAPDHGSYLRVKPTSSGLLSGKAALRCPTSCTLSFLNAVSHVGFANHRSCPFPPSFVEAVDRHTVTVFFLVQQYLLGSESYWAPYLKSLPQPGEIERLATPLWFTVQETEWLQGTNLHGAREMREKEWRRKFERGGLMLERADWKVEEEYTW